MQLHSHSVNDVYGCKYNVSKSLDWNNLVFLICLIRLDLSTFCSNFCIYIKCIIFVQFLWGRSYSPASIIIEYVTVINQE